MNPTNWTLEKWSFAVAVLTLLATVVCGVFAGLALRRPIINAIPMSRVAAPPWLRTGRSAVLWSTATFVFFLITIALMTQLGKPGTQGPQGLTGAQGLPGIPDTHIATAYWYRVDLNNIRDLFSRWNNVTENELNNYLNNRGPTPLSTDNNNLGTIEANIKGLVRKDFGIELDFSRHPRFDGNRFYPAPNVDQIVKDYDKEEYRRTYDQYYQERYTLYQVISAYERQISVQEDYIITQVQSPSDCRYTQNGNFDCP